MTYNIFCVVLMQMDKKFLSVLCKTSSGQTGRGKILSYLRTSQNMVATAICSFNSA